MQVGKIEVTGVPLEALVRAAYRPSRPQGLGFIHYQEGDLTDDEVAEIIGRGNERTAISMDYVNGRSCKFHVMREGDRLFIKNKWYDHSTESLKSILAAVGLSPDLVDRARKEEAEYHESCVGKAMGALKKNNGVYTRSIRGDDSNREEDTELGMLLLEDRGLVAHTFDDGIYTYKPVEKAA